LLLRPIWPEDWQALLAGIADEGVVRNLARAPWPYQERDARAFTALPVEPLCPRFLITRARDAQVLGCIGIEAASTADTPELGYWIARPFWGQGYATEAAQAVVKVAQAIGHTRLTAGHFADNPASGRVLRKIGFRPTGQITKRHSRARGESVDTVEYALELDADCAPFPVKRAA
jgi:RimJ/RimL family protein N-acetyltransferase